MSADRTRKAQQIVASQIGCSVREALAVIERLATDAEEPLDFVVDELLAGHVSFDPAQVA
jgi:hypothetical protein